MNRFTFAAVSILGSFLAASTSASSTFVFFISGDNDYRGAVLEKKWVIRDQAKALYRQALELAKSDKQNRYAIFYDPKGRSFPFSDRHVRFDYVDRAKVKHTNGLFESEIDATDESVFERLSAGISKHLTQAATGSVVFYYFGEHIPANPSTAYDLSEKDSTRFNMRRFALALKRFQSRTPIDLLILQTCFNGDAESLRLIAETGVQRAIVPRGAVLRTPPNLALLTQAGKTLEELSTEFSEHAGGKEAKHYDFSYYGDLRSLMPYLKTISEAEKADPFGIIRNMKTSFLNAAQGSEKTEFENLASQAQVLPLSKEVFIQLTDFIGFGLNDEQARQIEQGLSRFPELGDILVSLSSPLTPNNVNQGVVQ